MIELIYGLIVAVYVVLISYSVYNSYKYFSTETELELVWEDRELMYYTYKFYYYLNYAVKVITLQVFASVIKGKLTDIDFWK